MLKPKVKLLILTVALVFLSAPVHAAQFSARTYNEVKNGSNPSQALAMETYAVGVGVGIVSYNMQMKAMGREPMFCLPSELVLSPEFYLYLLDAEIGRAGGPENIPNSATIDFILMLSFQKRFPCGD